MDTQQTSVMKSRRALITSGIVVLVIVAGVIGYYFSKAPRPGTGGTDNKGPQIVQSEKGALPATFPPSLISEKGVSFTESYTVNDGRISQPVVKYVSTQTLLENVQMFKTYFTRNNWKITHEPDISKPVDFFAASHENEIVNVTLVRDEKTGKVTVSIAYAKL